MNTLAVTPEMFGQKPLTAPNVTVAASLVEQPEDVGFDFDEYYDMLRSTGVPAEDISSNIIHYSDEISDNLGLYEPDERKTTVYVTTCKTAAASVAQGETQPYHRGYKPVSPYFRELVNDITIHETGHFQHDILYPTHTPRMRLLDRGIRASLFIPVIEGFGMAARNYPAEAAAPVVIGSIALILAAAKGIDYHNPRERPAFRFERDQEGRKIVDFAVSPLEA
jgi:hypothetical protein